MERYSFNPVTNTLTISAAFAKQAQNPNSDEYKLMLQLRSDFPGLKIAGKTHRSPTKYHTKSGEVFCCNQFKNLKYKNMEAFMSALPNSEELLDMFTFIKKDASLVQTSRYTVARRWFMAQFPLFRSNPMFYLENPVTTITDLSPYLPENTKKDA